MLYKVLLGIVLLFFVGYLWVKKRFQYWSDRGFLQGSPSFPMGTLSGVGTKMTNSEKLDVYYEQFKGKAPFVGLYNFLSPIILAIDPEFIKNVLVRDFQSFHDRGMFYNKEDDPIGVSTLTLSGQDWKERRVKLTPIFTSGKIKMMFEIVDVISNKLITTLENETLKTNDLEMRNWLQKFTIDNIGNVAFGIDPNCLQDETTEFTFYCRKLTNGSFLEAIKFLFSVEWPDLARKLHLTFVNKEVGDFFLKTFTQTLEDREKSQIDRNDFVKLLLGLKDVYTKEELAAEAFLVFAGGFETSSTLMTFALYELALNPDIQDRLREEITAGIEENDGKLTYDLLFGFKYLDMVVNEALRKYPPIPIPMRKCRTTYKVPGTELVIPDGTIIQINLYSLQRDPEYFPDPEKFDPERFSDENARNIKPFTNLPFGEGPRNCLGMRFGMMQSKIGITKVIKNFIVSPCEKTSIPIKLKPSSPFLSPENGMWLNMKKIE
ncbi:probable cytochrome P450 6a13 [Chironomus tepperi]|uniref:probable cytochrome P450 6a13 n=1 Tax=Chironomus tepperi TaxID=113505 RepID=UPI00391F5271